MEKEPVMTKSNYIVYVFDYVSETPDSAYCKVVDKQVIYKDITENELNKNLSLLVCRGMQIRKVEKFKIEQYYTVNIKTDLEIDNYGDLPF